jgi:hypothetical protein
MFARNDLPVFQAVVQEVYGFLWFETPNRHVGILPTSGQMSTPLRIELHDLHGKYLVNTSQGWSDARKTFGTRPRRSNKAGPKTINDEVLLLVRLRGGQGDLIRAKLRREKAMKLATPPSPGRAYTADEKARMLTPALHNSGSSLDRRRARPMKPVANAQEDRQPLIDRRDLFPRKFPEHAPDPPLIDWSQMVD